MAQGRTDEIPLGGLERQILIHLLEHRGHVIRFEADAGTTEFGIIRKFPVEGVSTVRGALRNLEMYRWTDRRMQYVIGYSEPKLVYMLTPAAAIVSPPTSATRGRAARRGSRAGTSVARRPLPTPGRTRIERADPDPGRGPGRATASDRPGP